jgi:hypothetical protein
MQTPIKKNRRAVGNGVFYTVHAKELSVGQV